MSEQAERRTVRSECGEIEYWLTRKRVKNINLRIARDGRVSASAPRRVSAEMVDGFVRSKAAFVRRHLARIEATAAVPAAPEREGIPFQGRLLQIEAERGEPPAAVREGDRLRLRLPDPEDPAARRALAEDWFERRGGELLAAMGEEVAARFAPWKLAPTRIRVRSMVSRWGSCSPRTGAITLNLKLAALPPEAAEYVIIHEFAHLRHPNHSPAFWAFVEAFAPDWRAQRATLNRWQRELGM